MANTPPIRSSPGGDSRTEKRAPSRNAKASHISTVVKTSALLWRYKLPIGERGGGHEYNQDKHDELALLVALSTLWARPTQSCCVLGVDRFVAPLSQ